MSGTKIGGLKAAEANKANDPDFYRKMGQKGGSVSHPETRLFRLNKDLAREAGRRGGTISRRYKKKETDDGA